MDKVSNITVITGAAGGLGKEMVRKIVSAGYVVVMLDLQEESLKIFRNSFSEKEQGRIYYYATDITDSRCVEDVFLTIESNIGPIRYLINSAGIDYQTGIFETTDEIWEKTLRVNLMGTFIVCRTACRYMIERKEGTVVNISSRMGVCGFAGDIAYSAAKGGVIAFTRSLAAELGEHNIAVNCIAPGVFITEMSTDLREGEMAQKKLSQMVIKRFGEPTEVADAIWFLMHQTYLTGHTLHLNGGSYMN